MKNPNQGQQGDVTFTKISSLPEGCKELKRENGILILVKGETSGHNHAVLEEGAKAFTLTKPDGTTDLFLVVEAPTVTVDHPEHKAQIKETGVYKVGQVQEFDYFALMARQVRD